MADKNRRAGTITFQANGAVYDAVGDFSYNLGDPKREALIGSDKVHGYKETPQVAFIEGSIRDASDLNVRQFKSLTNATVTLELANGKIIMLRSAYYASEGKQSTDEGTLECRFEGLSAEEV